MLSVCLSVLVGRLSFGSICLPVSLLVGLSACGCVSFSVCLFLHLLAVYLRYSDIAIRRSVSSSVCLPVGRSAIRPLACRPGWPFVCPPVYLPVRLSVGRPVGCRLFGRALSRSVVCRSACLPIFWPSVSLFIHLVVFRSLSSPFVYVCL